MKTKTEFLPKEVVYTPPEVINLGVSSIKEIEANQHRAINLHIPVINEYFAPLAPGQVCAVIAQTSNYKSGFMHSWGRAVADQLVAQNRHEVVVHVSVEEIIEQQAIQYFAWETGEDSGALTRGKVNDWANLLGAAIKIGTIPIYRVGESIKRAQEMSQLYLSNVVRALKSLEEGKITGETVSIAAVFVDYLQALPYDPEVRRQGGLENLRRLQVREDVYRLCAAAAWLNCPIVVGVQAKQELKGNPSPNMLTPGVYDGEETSALAQRFDRVITLWMPKQTHELGTILEHQTGSFKVEEDILWLKVAKQRGGLQAGKSWMCRINFQNNTISVAANAQSFDASQINSRRRRIAGNGDTF